MPESLSLRLWACALAYRCPSTDIRGRHPLVSRASHSRYDMPITPEEAGRIFEGTPDCRRLWYWDVPMFRTLIVPALWHPLSIARRFRREEAAWQYAVEEGEDPTGKTLVWLAELSTWERTWLRIYLWRDPERGFLFGVWRLVNRVLSRALIRMGPHLRKHRWRAPIRRRPGIL